MVHWWIEHFTKTEFLYVLLDWALVLSNIYFSTYSPLPRLLSGPEKDHKIEGSRGKGYMCMCECVYLYLHIWLWLIVRYIQVGGVEGCVLIFSGEKSKITTCCWATIDRRMLDPTFCGSHHKKIYHIQEQRRSPKKMVGAAKSYLEWNPIPTRDTWRAQTKPCPHQENPQRLSQTYFWVFECLLWRCGSAVAWCRVGALDADMRMA